MNRRERLVVIGNGMAGARMVEELLARGGQDRYDIVMFGDEPYGNYNRILLSNVLNGSQGTSEIFLNPLDWYSQNNVRLHAGERVIGVDRERQRVFGASGLSEPYDRLVFATGSRPFVPRMEGLKTADDQNKPGIFVFRTIEDCERIADYAQDSKRAAVIGGGLLGLEAAKGLMTHGVEVHVVHLAQALMENQVDEAGAKILAKTMGDLGVNLHLGKSTQRVFGDERVEGLEFSDGTTLEVDMVVISCGIMANVDLARDCGLDVERAILVDDQMRTPHDARVYAVGECAQHRGKVYGLVAPLWEQGKVLADHLVGRTDVAYGGSKIATKLKVMGVDLASMGITKPETDDDEVMVCSEAKRGIYRKLIIRDDRLIGAILLGDTSKAASLIQAFDSGSPLPDNRAEALFDIGETKGPASPVDLPDTAQICNCNGVSKGAIYACVKSGRKSLKMVMDATRAGMGCGSCKSSVATLVEHACGGSMIEDPSIHYYVPGVPLRKPELIEAIMEQELRSVSAVFMQLADGVEDPGSKMGLSSLLRTIWGKEYEDERDARFINDRVHANIQKDRTFSVIPRIAGGVTSAAELRKIADVADKYDVPMVKITGGQRIDLLGIKKEDLPGVWQDLGMPSGHGYAKSFRTCKTCVGTDFCRFGLGDSTGLGIAIETRFAGLESPGKLKLATAGCPRNCSEAYIKDVGVVAIEGGLWEIYVGGAGGAHVRKGDLLCTVNSHEDVLLITGRFIQYYRENAKYLERTYGFVERVGIAKIRAVVIEDEEGIAGRLDAAIQESVDSYVDPWLEAGAPATKNQFLTALPMVKA